MDMDGTSSVYLAVHLDIQKGGVYAKYERVCTKKEIAMAVYNIN